MSNVSMKDIYQTLRAARRLNKVSAIATAYNFAVENIGVSETLKLTEQIDQTRFYDFERKQALEDGLSTLCSYEFFSASKGPLGAYRLYRAIQRNNALVSDRIRKQEDAPE
ncbi:hypothetical protein VISI1226_13748 [Vibrio sinaloensis DSM 21326]|uniref:Uncharacterized protein n=1 Tax=Vibrio sinaloensis DSM 21326 TaxID=945550 RepID=E8M8P5_PHOS4|nr:hypothetical protein [Vibrio sinaloensis]EGA69590.1 hypothetical protein VISI1226_13748 [Vibrio sinaloensis DSM 21326]